jgi:hypothetical protein
MRNPRRGPLVDLIDGTCPATTVSVSAGDLPLQQQCIAGTTAHSISMSRRNAVKSANGNLKRNFTNVDRGYARVFGTVKVAFLFAFTLAGLNVFLARSFGRMLKSEKKRDAGPKRRAARRDRTYTKLLGPEVRPSSIVDPADRAPP